MQRHTKSAGDDFTIFLLLVGIHPNENQGKDIMPKKDKYAGMKPSQLLGGTRGNRKPAPGVDILTWVQYFASIPFFSL